MAKKKMAQAAGDGTPKRPGPRGNFHGLRLKFLESKLPTFFDKVSARKTHNWWPVIHAEYWSRISWRVPLDQEVDSTMFDDASVPIEIDEDLSEEDKQMKTEVMKKVNPMVKTWFTNRKSKGVPKTSVWSTFLKQLVQPTGGVPKKRNIAQYYMVHTDYKAKVDTEFDHRVEEEDIPPSEHLKIRSYIAKKFFLQEDKETKERLEKENDLTHKKMVAAYEAAWKGLPPINPDGQDEALEELEELVQPLLDGFEAYTGVRFVLTGGRPPRQESSKYTVVV
ncbi:hypothetical protein PILCRDRAFT_5052 [Piloderma croceum F 1598]|uniref:Uncharacterized protein n=1 Tax=Piloderma croceum (strain F 1598) TaxID=765440 RepID=A0A0C3BI08_PILCF|nr:hypothetical protein PILCRDRAFT_5052 [Piloderma croceum F 1598]